MRVNTQNIVLSKPVKYGFFLLIGKIKRNWYTSYMETIHIDKSMKKYFRDIDVHTISFEAFTIRILEKWTTRDINRIVEVYGFEKIKKIIEKEFSSSRIQFSPNLVALFSLRFHISDDISRSAMKRSKENDFFVR